MATTVHLNKYGTFLSVGPMRLHRTYTCKASPVLRTWYLAFSKNVVKERKREARRKLNVFCDVISKFTHHHSCPIQLV